MNPWPLVIGFAGFVTALIAAWLWHVRLAVQLDGCPLVSIPVLLPVLAVIAGLAAGAVIALRRLQGRCRA